MQTRATLDRQLDRLAGAAILALAAVGVAIVGAVDYLTGYEVSLSLFYLGPVGVAAWYGGRWSGLTIAVLSCVGWYLADIASGNAYSHPAIPIWNALIRLGFFVTTGLLLAARRKSMLRQELLVHTDSLTGLYSRRAFEDRLKHDLALAQRRGSALTLAYIDLDDFKAVNDTYGHAGGDKVLELVGRVLSASVRKADTAARVGGDEFALILPDTDARGARHAVSNLTSELRSAPQSGDPEVTCSIGVVTLLDSTIAPEVAVAAADELMYEVKRQGKGAVAFRTLGEAVQPGAAVDRLRAVRRRDRPSSVPNATAAPATESREVPLG